jgi:transcriptional regulator with XRE-family HTH domain
MNLKEYYKQISEPIAPKKQFIQEVAKKLEVSEATVRGWVNGRFKPSHPSFYRGLSELTGIPENELFDE